MPAFSFVQRMTSFAVSITLAIGLGMACYLFKIQDSTYLQQALSDYEQQSLLSQEQSIYLDFIQRRLRVEQIGSLEYLSQLENAINRRSSNEVAQMILRDRFFYGYVVEEGRLFMSPSVYQSWKDQRDQFIEPTLSKLSERQFGLKPEQFGASNLVSYIVVEDYTLRLVANVLLLLVLGIYIEPKIGKGKMLLLFVTASLVSSGSYALLVSLFGHHNEPIMQSATGAVLGIFALALMNCLWTLTKIKTDGRNTEGSYLALLFGITLFVIGKTGFEWWVGLIGWKMVLSYVLALATGVLMYVIFRKAISFENDNVSSDSERQSWAFRVARSEVMEAISKFDFKSAREKIAQLMKQYPDSIELIEQRYHLEKLQSDGGVYWDCTRDLVNFAVKKKDYHRMKNLFEDIQKNAASKKHAKARLAPEYYHKMMMVFVKHDDLNKAEQAFMFLELAGHTHIINDACLLLQQEFKARGNVAKERQYQMLLERL